MKAGALYLPRAEIRVVPPMMWVKTRCLSPRSLIPDDEPNVTHRLAMDAERRSAMKHFRSRWVAISLTILLSITSLMLVPALPTQAAGATLVVNANQTLRPVTHAASGGLYALGSDSTPDDSMVIPLHPRIFTQMAPGGHQRPGGDALVVAPKAARAGAKVSIRMPDYYPDFPYKWVSWSDWLNVVDGQIAAVQAARNVTNIASWEPWNEPDWTWDTANAGDFNAGWVRTYQEIRSKDLTTPIVGPSTSWYNASYMSSFLSYAKANNALPDIICWHELGGGQGSIASDISAYRSLEASLGISPRPIAINEYASTSEVGIPGLLVGYIAKFERGGVDYANLPFWNQYGTFNDMVINNNQPNGAWWLYKWYGDMTGNMVVTTPPAQTGLDGAASINSAGNQVSVILGGDSGNDVVTVTGLNALSAFGSSATVTLEYVASSGRTNPSSGTVVLSTSNYTISNGSLTVPINNMDSTGGYHLLITPSGAATPTPTVSPTRTPTPTPSPTGSACKIAYTVPSQWSGGFTANIVITNTQSTTINGWTLRFTFASGQQITQGWNAAWSQSGANVTAQNLSYNNTIATNSSVSMGFNGSWTGSNPNPTGFTLNGSSCTS
jgi:hypothetical protein